MKELESVFKSHQKTEGKKLGATKFENSALFEAYNP